MRQSAGQLNSVRGSPLNVGMGVALGCWLCRCRQPSRHCEWWYRGRCVPGSMTTVFQQTCRCPRPPETPVQSPYRHHQTPTVVQELGPRCSFFLPPNFHLSQLWGLVYQFDRGCYWATTNKYPWSRKTTGSPYSHLFQWVLRCLELVPWRPTKGAARQCSSKAGTGIRRTTLSLGEL